MTIDVMIAIETAIAIGMTTIVIAITTTIVIVTVMIAIVIANKYDGLLDTVGRMVGNNSPQKLYFSIVFPQII